MTKKKALHSLSILALIAIVSLSARAAHADTIFELTSPIQTAPAGAQVTFSGILTNTGTGTVYLNGDAFNVTGGFTLASDDFLNDAPFSLDPGMSYMGAFLTVMTPGVFPSGFGTGSFSILGGADVNSLDTLNTANFEIDAPSAVAPEPDSVLLLGTGLMAAAAMIYRRRFVGAQIESRL